MEILSRLIDSMQSDLAKLVQKLVQIKSVKGEKNLYVLLEKGQLKLLPKN